MISLHKILVPTDFDEAADAALTYGRTLARAFGATLHVLHVADDAALRIVGGEGSIGGLYSDVQRDIDEAARTRLNQLIIDNDPTPVPARPVLLKSTTAALAIVQYAKEQDVDLIVMGTHGRGGLAHLFMGSVAERVVRIAPCPVLTVRHPEHEFVLPDALTVVTRA